MNKPTRRSDIQGLRAVAVALVLLFHAFPAALPGGFVGVDVFFVISGYLITGLLLRELETTGRISLPTFYARRIRRLLPAALTVTATTLIASAALVGPVQLARTLQDAAWATFSLANFRFSAGDGYFTQGDPSPFLHFWSLSVEEQFYLLWPAVLLVVAFVPRGQKVIPVLLGVVIIGSLTASVWLTTAGSPSAYFSLLTRAWELGVGGILAAAAARGLAPRRRVAVVLPFVGLAAILISGVAYSDATPFPGWAAAVPVVGTALVIWGGSGPIARALSLRPLAYVGDISYSLYLWHWPVLILGPLVLGTSPLATFVLVSIAVGLAALSFHFIELRGMHIRKRAHPIGVLAAGIATIMVVSGCAYVAADRVPMTSNEVVAEAPTVPASLDHDEPSGPGPVPTSVPANVSPTLAGLLDDLAPVFTNGCYQGQMTQCSYGTGPTTIVLAGDSHAGMWWPAFAALADTNGWTIHVVGHNGCPIVNVPITQDGGSLPWPECTAWQAGAIAQVAALHPDLIVVDNHTTGYMTKVSLADDFLGKWEPALVSTLDQLQTIAPVLLMGQVPTFPGQPVDCLSEHLSDVQACSLPADQAVPPIVAQLNERAADATGVTYVDPTKFLCTDVCPMMAYNLIMYRDASHLNATYAAHLAPYMEPLILKALQ